MPRFVFAGPLILSVCLSAAKPADQPSPDAAKAQVDCALTGLINGEDFQRIGLLPMHWRLTLTKETQQALIGALMDRLESGKELKLVNLKEAYVLGSPDDPKRELALNPYVIKQDLFTESGRCAWALELLLDIDLPILNKKLNCEKENFEKNREVAKNKVLKFYDAVSQETPEQQAANAVKELLRTRDFRGELFPMPKKWVHIYPESIQKKIIVKLLKRLDCTKPLKLGNYEPMLVPSRFAAGKMVGRGEGLQIDQDVFLVNGRCAWAIEELVDRAFPVVFTEELAKDPKKLEAHIQAFTFKVIEAMDMPRPKPQDVPKKDGSEHSEKPGINR